MTLSNGLFVAASVLLGMASAEKHDANPEVANCVQTFGKIKRRARSVTFQQAGVKDPRGGHFQGIQFKPANKGNTLYCFLSRDCRKKARIAVVQFDATMKRPGVLLEFHSLPDDGKQPPLRHPGGMQLIGDYLVVGVEDNQQRLRSQVQFLDVSDPNKPKVVKHLTILRQGKQPGDKTAGAVGIVKRANDHLLVVANWDSRCLDFYRTNGKPLQDKRCRFRLLKRWSAKQAVRTGWKPDRRWGKYQSINLLREKESGRIFLVGFNTAFPSRDFADLFVVDASQPANRMIRKVANKHLQLRDGAHFRYAGGLRIDSATRLSIFASERDLHRRTTINVAR